VSTLKSLPPKKVKGTIKNNKKQQLSAIDADAGSDSDKE
jgi:hypothetical protein